MQKQIIVLLTAGLFLTAAFSVAQSAGAEQPDVSAVKALVKSETAAFYQRNADAWASTWLHDAKISRAIIQSSSYYAATGWEKQESEGIDYLKKNAAKPMAVDITQTNYLIRMGTDMAWIEYDQTMTAPGADPANKRFSREQRLLVKQDGQWKIAHQITVDPETFGSDAKTVESNLNTNGYLLMRDKKVTEAIEVFKTNVKLYPDSWNTYDSLGEAYAAAGNKELAIQNYEHSIKLNPKSENGKAALAKLKQK